MVQRRAAVLIVNIVLGIAVLHLVEQRVANKGNKRIAPVLFFEQHIRLLRDFAHQLRRVRAARDHAGHLLREGDKRRQVVEQDPFRVGKGRHHIPDQQALQLLHGLHENLADVATGLALEPLCCDMQRKRPAPGGLLKPCRVLRPDADAVFQEELNDLFLIEQHKILVEYGDDIGGAELVQVRRQLRPPRHHDALSGAKVDDQGGKRLGGGVVQPVQAVDQQGTVRRLLHLFMEFIPVVQPHIEAKHSALQRLRQLIQQYRLARVEESREIHDPLMPKQRLQFTNTLRSADDVIPGHVFLLPALC